jgi:hypothetical protein
MTQGSLAEDIGAGGCPQSSKKGRVGARGKFWKEEAGRNDEVAQRRGIIVRL